MNDLDAVIQTLQTALATTADKAPLQKHLAALFMQVGRWEDAEKLYRELLLIDTNNIEIKLALANTFFHQQKTMMALVVLDELIKHHQASGEIYLLAARAYYQVGQIPQAQQLYRQAITKNAALQDGVLEAQLAPMPEAAFNITDEKTPQIPISSELEPPIMVENWPQPPENELEHTRISFKDVGGMEKIKDDIRMKIIHPLRNQALYKAYGKTIGGGILMYGPPGCGKTHLARATAGEVSAYFIAMGIHDVLNMYRGQSENNLHELFEMARRNKPCVLFIDEVDALGASRSDMRHSDGRHVINQLLSEMDGVETSNEGILILAASNAPWHMDSALRRPGRFDQVIFVPPPDKTARVAILRVMLMNKPVEAIDFDKVATETAGFSGADLKGLVDRAIEEKLRAAIQKGIPIPLTTRDLLSAVKMIKPSTADWFATARNYALYSNQGGTYDDILAYLKLNTKEGGLLSKFIFGDDE
jgi:SpoVK/Ycf46/Vps4 family AAA+-type ATPase